jgi:high-affinity nickel-transport protein
MQKDKKLISSREITSILVMASAILTLFFLGFVLLIIGAGHHYHISKTQIFGIGTGILALTLGMRHAFDADHIAAIDNTTRKLAGENKRALGTGFFFSLGHSTIVFIVSLLLGLGIRVINDQIKQPASYLHNITGVFGTIISGFFLYFIAILNLIVFVSIFKLFLEMRKGIYSEEKLEQQLQLRGFMNRFFGKLARRVDKSWKMYPVGVLFGLGFDTATEVALLVLSSSAVAGGMPIWVIISLPLLFAAGMSLFDTLDGIFMNFAYGWAFLKPVRKIYYNLVVTILSIGVAFLICTIELTGLLASEFDLHGFFWNFMSNFDINKAGFVIVVLFVLTWAAAIVVWKIGKIEERFSMAATE